MTKITFCTCNHKGQDALHGAQQRVFNAGKSKSGLTSIRWSCSVCLRSFEEARKKSEKE